MQPWTAFDPSSFWGSRVVAERLAWPRGEKEQKASLLAICPMEWDKLSEGEVGLVLDLGFQPSADYELETRFGHRRFSVWTAPTPFGSERALVVRLPAEVNAPPVMASCVLAVCGGNLEASFYLSSGLQFGKQIFDANPQPVYFADLQDAAQEEALKQGLLESRFQQLQLFLDGLTSRTLPRQAPVWIGGMLTAQTLKRRLAHLHAVSVPELAATAAEPTQKDPSNESCATSSSSSGHD